MAVNLDKFAAVLRSPLCDVSEDVYQRYLGVVAGVARVLGSSSGSFDSPVGFATDGCVVAKCAGRFVSSGDGIQRFICGGDCTAGVAELCVDSASVSVCDDTKVGSVGFVECSVVSEDNKVRDSVGIGGIVDGTGNLSSGVDNVSDQLGDAAVVSDSCHVGLGVRRGPNFLRNQANRIAQKARKKKRQAVGDDWRMRNKFGVKCEAETVVGDGQQGFWKSCSAQVRQDLIDSKARMHIAENERREREARDKLSYMDSPYGVMQRCVKMAEFAQKQAEKEKDGKIYGWAQSVACSSAESLAKTLPSSVPSYEELSAKLDASSQSSFELELQAKQNEIDSVKSRSEEENRKMQSLVDEERKKAQEFEKKYIAVQRRIKQMELDSNPQVRVMSFSKRDFEEEMRPPRFRGVMG